LEIGENLEEKMSEIGSKGILKEIFSFHCRLKSVISESLILLCEEIVFFPRQ